MDFRNLCQKLDMDNIKTKLPPLPPVLKQIKLPKALPKLKSRKIFRSSRENVNCGSIKNSTINSRAGGNQQQSHLQPPPPADFIKQTPTRISTISSLMPQDTFDHYRNTNTYQSAGRIDDDFPTPTQYNRHHSASSSTAVSKPISPIRIPHTIGNNDNTSLSGSSNRQNLSFGQRLQKGYKDISDFKFKHIFAKKTVVRKDNIEVAHYVQRYNEDLAREEREQQRRDDEIAENYRIHFTLSRQNTINSNESDEESKSQDAYGRKQRHMSELSDDDESGMEVSPPSRKKPGIAASRFSRVRNPPADMSLEDNFEDCEDSSVAKDNETDKKSSKLASMKLKERMKTLKTKYMPSTKENDMPKPQRSPQTSDDENEKRSTNPKGETANENGTFGALKTNLKRLQKSIKKPAAPTRSGSTDDDGDDYPEEKENLKIKALKLKARLQQFRSSDDVSGSRQAKSDDETGKSPIRSKFTDKLQTWKKSFKRQASEGDVQRTEDESTPEKHKRSDTLIQKLKYIRSRKNPNSNEELDNVGKSDGEAASKTTETRKLRNIEEKFQQARQRTLKKVNDKMQQMKIFHKDSIDKTSSQDKDPSCSDEETEHKPVSMSKVRKSLQEEAEEEEMEFDDDAAIQTPERSYAKWTSRPIRSDSMDTDDPDGEFPRVLIHQDNSNVFESTLIIAVTRSPSVVAAVASPIITEITDSPKQSDWVPNSEIIKGFKANGPPDFIADKRKTSDSSRDSDSWLSKKPTQAPLPLPPLKRRPSHGDLTAEDPWKVESTKTIKEKLYKTKSIDIFEATKANPMTAFDNFDEELQDEPVLKIVDNVDAYERESSEDPDGGDDDNSSRVTKISVKPQIPLVEVKPFSKMPPLRQIGNSQESLIAQKGESEENEEDSDYHYDEDEDEDLVNNEQDEDEDDDEDEEGNDGDDDENEDRPPSAPPSPPPSMSPPPPPLPERKAAIRTSIRVKQNEPDHFTPSPSPPPPPLPATKPPLPANKPLRTNSTQPPTIAPKVPERSSSMSGVSKPLVKTSSLRLAYHEQPQPRTELNQRPRLVPRTRQDSEELSDEEPIPPQRAEEIKLLPFENNRIAAADHEELPPLPRRNNKNPEITISKPPRSLKMKIPNLSELSQTNESSTLATTMDANGNDTDSNYDFKSPLSSSKNSLNMDSNYNYSLPNSEYGSPLTYPSSLIGSAENTPISSRKLQHHDDMLNGTLSRRSRRSMTRDNESFYSFDSDEENSFYSISSSTSNRYVVDL